MRYIKFGTFTGRENMQIDSDLLDEAINTQTKEPIFRLYAWSPKCISLGRNQECTNVLEKNRENGINIDIVRRITGGRALLHDDEITYCYVIPTSIIPNGDSVRESYKYISGILIKFFNTLGINLTFGDSKKVSTKFDYCMLISTGADLCYNGRKIIGSAQYRKNGYILQHGSILFDYNKRLLEALFNEEVSSEHLATVKEILPDMTKEKFVEAFEEFLTREML